MAIELKPFALTPTATIPTGGVKDVTGGGSSAPVLSAATVTSVTTTGATPRVTLTF